MFPYSGGDVETLFLQCKIVHGRRMPPEEYRKILSMNDIINGFDKFIGNRTYKKKDEPPFGMYI